MLFHVHMSVERDGIELAPLAVEIAAGRLEAEAPVEAGGARSA